MSMNIRPTNDYSFLFSSLSNKKSAASNLLGGTGKMSDLTTTVLGGGSSTMGGINLGDYASIKNGSYGKLMKSYFNMKEEQANLKTDEIKKEFDETDKTNTADKVEALGKSDKTDIFDKINTPNYGTVSAMTWEDIVAEAETKTDALYSELGLKKDTVAAGSYVDTQI